MNGEEILIEEIVRAINDQTLTLSAPMGQVVSDPKMLAREAVARFKARMTLVDVPDTNSGELAARLLNSLGNHSEQQLRSIYGDDRLVACYLILQDKVPPAWRTDEFRAKLAEQRETRLDDERSPFEE